MDTGYWTVTVVVDGAIDDEETITEEGDLKEYLHLCWAAATEDGLRTEVFVLRHDHPVWVEQCECIQFVSDLRPTHVFP